MQKKNNSMNTVKALKEKIEAQVKQDFDFEQYLFKKYPDLFRADDKGELLPQQCRCWNDCPKGWESIIDDLCGCIDRYIKCTSRSIPNPDEKLRFFLSKVWFAIARKIDRFFFSNNNLHVSKLRRFTNRIGRRYFLAKRLYISQPPPSVKIEQYKEKFGSLRFYVQGGDDEVNGMIRFAEYLCDNTCQNTGGRGSMVQKGGWYATLSSEEATRLGFSKPKEQWHLKNNL
jgi:hypothetical protein